MGADITEDCILGLDFLEGQVCFINIEDGVLYVRGVAVPLRYVSENGTITPCFRVVAVENVRVMPKTEAIIPARVLGYSGKAEWAIIEPNGNETVPGLVVGNVLATVHINAPMVPVRVNVADEMRNITAGTNLATVRQ